jgi:hypothetical protein
MARPKKQQPTTETKEPDLEGLEKKNRAELQSICKFFKLKANGKVKSQS